MTTVICAFGHLNLPSRNLNRGILYRQLTAVLLLAGFFVQTFSRDFVLVDYYANTARYAKLCENKARPKMHCNGRCQMMKKLQQEEKKSEDGKWENRSELTLSTKSFFATVSPKYIIPLQAKKRLPSSDGRSIDRSFDIFHPPQA